MSLDTYMLQAHQRRWQAVEQVKRTEQQNATIAERWQKLNALLRLATSLGLQSSEDDSLSDPRLQHWNQLKSLYLAEQQKGLL